MTEHSIEELERELQSAIDRRIASQQAEAAARQRLEDARTEATGLRGHLVQYERQVGWGTKARVEKRQMVVTKASGYGVEGVRVRKDGSIGTATGYASKRQITDLGPYVAELSK